MELTEEQARFAIQQTSRWLRIRTEHEKLDAKLGLYQHTPEAIAQTMTQLAADVDHSALLLRLLRGRDPLPEPPPLDHAYPVYPDWPYDETGRR